MKPLVAIAALLLLAGCASAGAPEESAAPAATESVAASASPSPTPSEAPAVVLSATEVATGLQGQIPSIAQIVTLDETNDPNDLIGRPNGYVDGAVLYDSTVEACPDLGVDCGATIEVWGDESGAQARSDYIQEILAGAPAFGSEYHYIVDGYLLRVSGDILPSVATQWETAFTAVLAG